MDTAAPDQGRVSSASCFTPAEMLPFLQFETIGHHTSLAEKLRPGKFAWTVHAHGEKLHEQKITELSWCSPAIASLLERSGAFGGYACLVCKHHYLVQECYIYHKPKQAGPPDG